MLDIAGPRTHSRQPGGSARASRRHARPSGFPTGCSSDGVAPNEARRDLREGIGHVPPVPRSRQRDCTSSAAQRRTSTNDLRPVFHRGVGARNTVDASREPCKAAGRRSVLRVLRRVRRMQRPRGIPPCRFSNRCTTGSRRRRSRVPRRNPGDTRQHGPVGRHEGSGNRRSRCRPSPHRCHAAQLQSSMPVRKGSSTSTSLARDGSSSTRSRPSSTRREQPGAYRRPGPCCDEAFVIEGRRP